MEQYLWFVILLGFLVDTLLLAGAGALAGLPPDWKRVIPGGLLGGLYAGAAATAQLYFLGNWYWRAVFMGLVCMVGFGMEVGTVKKGALYVLLRLALDGIGAGIAQGGEWLMGVGAAGLCLMCSIGFRGGFGIRYVPVELRHGDLRFRFKALFDTGHSLRDPLTGRSVMVVGPEIAQKMTGLTPEQLRMPAKSILSLPGGRLIPFKTISQSGGLLLALPVPDVQIGNWRGSCLVAFAPERLGNGEFEALTGGCA